MKDYFKKQWNQSFENFYVFLFFFSIMLLTMAPNIGGDAKFFFEVTKNLFHHGDFFYKLEAGKVLYVNYGLFLSLWMLPFYFLGLLLVKLTGQSFILYPLMGFSNTIIISIIPVCFYYVLRHFVENKKIRFYTTCLFIFTSMIWNYNTVMFTETMSVLFAIIIFEYFLRYKKNSKSINILWAGCLLGLCIHVKFSNYVLLFLPFFIYLCFIMYEQKKIDKRALLYFIIPYICSCILMLKINHYKYGIYSMNYHGLKPNFFWAFDGIYGQLFSIGKGLFVYNITLILSFIYIKDFFKKFKIESMFFAVLFFLFVSVNSLVVFWHAGSAWGPRYVLPMLPFCFIPISLFVKYILSVSRKIKIMVGVFFIIIGFIQLNSFVFSFMDWTMILKREKISTYEKMFYPRYSDIFGVNYLAYTYFKDKIIGKSNELGVQKYCRDATYKKTISMSKYIKEIKPGLWIYKLLSKDFKEKNQEKLSFANNKFVKIFGVLFFLLCIFLAFFSYFKIKKIIA